MSDEINTDDILQKLLPILRDNTLWPEDFVWNYTKPVTCGLGLIKQVFGQRFSDKITIKIYNNDSYKKIFYNAHRGTNVEFKDVTPEMVADEIDAYLNEFFCFLC